MFQNELILLFILELYSTLSSYAKLNFGWYWTLKSTFNASKQIVLAFSWCKFWLLIDHLLSLWIFVYVLFSASVWGYFGTLLFRHVTIHTTHSWNIKWQKCAHMGLNGFHIKCIIGTHWADDKQSKARNLDSKYRQMALVGFDT